MKCCAPASWLACAKASTRSWSTALKASRDLAVRIVVPKPEMATSGCMRSTIAGQSAVGATCSCISGANACDGRRDTRWTANPARANMSAACLPTRPEPPAMTIFRLMRWLHRFRDVGRWHNGRSCPQENPRYGGCAAVLRWEGYRAIHLVIMQDRRARR